jgi:hypothetical protein
MIGYKRIIGMIMKFRRIGGGERCAQDFGGEA